MVVLSSSTSLVCTTASPFQFFFLIYFFLFTYQPPFSLEDLSSHKNHTSARSSRGCNKNKIIIIEVTKVKKKNQIIMEKINRFLKDVIV